MDDWQKQLDVKIDRLLNDVEFIKNRTSSYLGRHEALTYLRDETPIFVNTDDFGCPINFLDGGAYEEDYFSVFLSYRKAETVVLDIGANLGVYSIRMASYMRNTGKIIAFEPIRRIRELFARSVFLNGYGNIITIHPNAVSDHDGEAVLTIPHGHAGGGSLELSGAVETAPLRKLAAFFKSLGRRRPGPNGETVLLRKLDAFFPNYFACDLIKLDVEGHELSALRGMQRIMQRSPRCVVMFEKLIKHSGIEAGMYEYAAALNWAIYGIDGVTLSKLNYDSFCDKGGYFVAGSPKAVEEGGKKKNFFCIYPQDLNVRSGEIRGDSLHVTASAPAGNVLVHGPYWFLPRGYYRIALEGSIAGNFQLALSERFGYKVAECDLNAGQTFLECPIYRDLCKFEIVLKSVDERAELDLKRIQVTRLA